MIQDTDIKPTPWLLKKLGKPPFRKQIRLAGLGGDWLDYEYYDENKEFVYKTNS